MNGQTRAAPDKPKDYSQLNLIKKVEVIENHRNYKKIYYIKPFGNTHFAYLDGKFMGYTVPQKGLKGSDLMDTWFMEPKQAIDYYHKTFNEVFRNPTLEYDHFINQPEYVPYITALKFKMDSDKKSNGNKD